MSGAHTHHQELRLPRMVNIAMVTAGLTNKRRVFCIFLTGAGEVDGKCKAERTYLKTKEMFLFLDQQQ